MPFFRESTRKSVFKLGATIILLIGTALSTAASAAVGSQPIHSSGDKQLWDRKANKVELFGHASVSQVGETLTADYIFLDLNSRVVDARGNCVYIAAGSVIVGEEMHFNLDTRTGTVISGRVSNERFSLRGERINKLGAGRFQTHWGEYTTCRDCDASWSIQAEDVDMEIDGYAFLSNVTTRIKDTPAFWLPYLVVPMKTRRQSGFLFPRISISGANGAALLIPYFWAIDRSSDMTFGLGQYTKRGLRLEWEGRYAFSPRSGGQANARYQYDRTFFTAPNETYHPASPQRWSLDIAQTQELPGGIEEKMKISEVSDNIYPYHFPNDVPGNGEAFLPSRLNLSWASSDVSIYVALQRYRNLLNSTPGDLGAQLTGFDTRTVQALPTIAVTTNERSILGSGLMGGMTVGFTNFTRAGGYFDFDPTYTYRGASFGTAPSSSWAFTPGVDPIRESIRLSVTPTIYTTFRPFDVISVVPSLQYRGYFYNFGNVVPNLNRGYLLFQTDLTAQIEKIFDFPDDPNIPRAKHLIRPILTYSFIPPFTRQNQDHPFLQQIARAQANGISGYNFDDNDIVPIYYTRSGANYFTPLGNSLTYGFTSQWIRRRGKLTDAVASYQNVFEFSAGQAINFLQVGRPYDQSNPLLTPLFASFGLNLERVQAGATYYYFTDIPMVSQRHTISASATYVLERSVRQKIMTFDRSLGLSYTFSQINANTSNLVGSVNFSLSDYILPTASVSYGFQDNKLYGANLGVQFQSPSRCWKLSTSIGYTPGQNIGWNLDLTLNLTGAGFGGLGTIASQVVSQ